MMTTVKIIDKLERLAYRLGDFNTYLILSFGLVIIAVRNTLSDSIYYMIETRDLAFYIILYAMIFWLFFAIVSFIWGVFDTSKRVKELGIAVIK